MLVEDLPYELRAYQKAAALKFAAKALAKRIAALVVLPTGCGKTRLAHYLGLSMGGCVLFLVHTDNLVNQVEREVRKLFPHVKLGVEKAKRNGFGEDYVIASVQTLGKANRLAAAVAGRASRGLRPFDLIVCDEAHHAIKDSAYDRIIKAWPTAHVLGLTATPARGDRKILGDVFPDDVVYRYKVADAVREGWLVPVSDGDGNAGRSRRIVVAGLDAALAKGADAGRDPLEGVDKEELRRAVVRSTADAMAEAIVVFGRKTVGFTLNVRCAKEIAETCRNRRMRVAYLHGQMKPDEFVQGDMRFKDEEDILLALRERRIDGIVNCKVMLEGYDDPSIDAIVWGRPTMIASVWVQGIGRGMRIDPARPMKLADGSRNEDGKHDVIVWDLVGAHDIHGLQTAELIFADEDEGEDEDVTEEGLEAAVSASAATDREKSLFANFLRALQGQRLRASSTHKRIAWLEVEEGECYAHRGADGRTYLVERAGEQWVAFREERGHCSVRLTEVGTFDEVQAKAARYARAGEQWDARDAKWRSGKPSAQVVGALAKFNVTPPPGTTAGEAGDILTIAVARASRRARRKNGVAVSGAALLD